MKDKTSNPHYRTMPDTGGLKITLSLKEFLVKKGLYRKVCKYTTRSYIQGRFNYPVYQEYREGGAVNDISPLFYWDASEEKSEFWSKVANEYRDLKGGQNEPEDSE